MFPGWSTSYSLWLISFSFIVCYDYESSALIQEKDSLNMNKLFHLQIENVSEEEKREDEGRESFDRCPKVYFIFC